MSVVIEHARKLDALGVVDDFWILISNESIIATGTGQSPPSSQRINAKGNWLTPGFIDLHSHGGGGHSFDNGPEAISAGLQTHRRRGTTRSIVSLVANPMDSLLTNLGSIADLVSVDPLILGSHLEGPFLSRHRSGAHNASYLRDPSIAEVRQLISAARGTLRQVTLAPELPGALAAIDAFVNAGVIVALGHTEASFELTNTAFDRGAGILTHAFNAMPGIHHRAPGPVTAAFGDDRIVIELILDGEHVHPQVAALLFAEAPGRIALITDAMAAADSPDGDYALGTLDVTVLQGLARLRGTSTIAGSTLTQDVALRFAMEITELSPTAAIEAVTLTPARALGLEHQHGLLAPGYVADAVLLTPDWQVTEVWANGSLVE